MPDRTAFHLATILAVAAALLAGCGGGKETGANSTMDARPAQAPVQEIANDPADEPGYRDGPPTSGQALVKSGRLKRFLEIGQAASPSQFERAAAILHSFLDARAAGEWEMACSHLSAAYIRLLQSSAEKEGSVDTDCPPTLEATTTNDGSLQELRAESVAADVGWVRMSANSLGKYALVIYRSAANAIMVTGMTYDEAAGWKVSLPAPCTLLGPSQSTARGCPIP